MKSWWKRTLRAHPVLSFFALFSLLCLGLLPIFRLSRGFAEWFSTGIGSFTRSVLGAVTAPLPFSLFEILIAAAILYALFLLGVLLFSLVRRCRGRGWPKRIGALCAVVPIVLLGVADLFALGFAPCYFRYSTEEHMAWETEAVGEEEVFAALLALRDVIGECAPLLEQNEAGESIAPPYEERMEAVLAAADAFGARNDFFDGSGAAPKALLVSPWLTYTHISGIYGFFTGEANVNTNYPHFVVTFAAAHEICHSRGIAAENECNVLASVLLLESDDPYLRYCGAAAMLDDVLSEAKRLDPTRTKEILTELSPLYRRDQAAYSRFFEPYRDSVAAEAAGTVNDAYLKSQGQSAGVRSYSMTVRLIASYFAKLSQQG